jgi:alpha-N-arabinofuranosidase
MNQKKYTDLRLSIVLLSANYLWAGTQALGTVSVVETNNVADRHIGSPNEVFVSINPAHIKGNISTMLTGVNVSWYYDTDAIWTDGSMADSLHKIKTKLLRYPGGVETSKLHWQTSYAHWNTDLWDPNIDPNKYPPDKKYMDTDDYIRQCRLIGAEPLIGINIQSGKKYNRIQDSIKEAAAWVRYCKEKKYNGTYWYLDNEPYYNSNCGPITASEYADYIKTFVPAMRAEDPDIKIIVGWENKLSVSSYWKDWELIIQKAGAYFDIADVHWYWAWGYATWDMWLNENPMRVREWCGDCSDKKYIGPSYVDDIRGFYDKIEEVNGVGYDIKLAALEWNIAPVKDGRFSTFQHALMQSEMLMQFIEGGLYMACIWPLTWGGDLYGDFTTVLDQKKHEPTPTFEVFKLFSNVLGQHLVTTSTDLPQIRSVSAISRDGSTTWLYMLNKSRQGQTIKARIALNNFPSKEAQAVVFTAPDVSSNISQIKELSIILAQSNEWTTVLPQYSLTMITFKKSKI